MAIVNRALDPSQQRQQFDFQANIAITAGDTGILSYVPYACVLQGAQMAAVGVQADINLIFNVTRFIPGQGVTTFNVGSTFAPVAFGTSGVFSTGLSLPAAGSTVLNLMTNDLIGYQAAGTGSTAVVFNMAGCFIVKPLQDNIRYLNSI